MVGQSSRTRGERWAVAMAVAFLFLLALAYFSLCLVVLHRPDWLPSDSLFSASLVGPPHWLVWGDGARPMFWGSTLAVAVVAIIGACSRLLLLPCAGLCFLLWLGSGFLSVVMSV